MTSFALVGASDFNSGHFAEAMASHAYQVVVAVDGGYASLCQAGYLPDFALGDFDSLGYEPPNVPVKGYSPEKDWSDMELALDYARERGAQAITAYGVLGGRLDHTIANIQIFAREAEKGRSITLVGLQEQVDFVVGPGELVLSEQERGTVSVFSLTPESRGVSEEGLYYELDNATLGNRTSLGLSNEFCGKPARIAVEEGTLIVIRSLEPFMHVKRSCNT